MMNDKAYQKIEGKTTAAEAMAQAGLNWSVALKPLVAQLDDGKTSPVPELHGLIRCDTEAVLGVVGQQYLPIQNVDVFAFFDHIVNEGKAEYSSAGQFRDGRVVWLLAKLLEDGELDVGGDTISKYVLFVTSHDTSLKTRMLITPFRTPSAAIINLPTPKAIGEFVLRHTRGAATGAAAAHDAYLVATSYYRKFASRARGMVETPFDMEDMEDLARYLFPDKKKTKEIHGRTDKNRERLISKFNSQTLDKKLWNTLWSAVVAVAEFGDRSKGSHDELSMEWAWLGDGAILKQKAFTWLEARV